MSSIEKILSREMKLINFWSCSMQSSTCCAWFDYYDQLAICTIVRMACGRRQPPRLVNLHSFGLVASSGVAKGVRSSPGRTLWGRRYGLCCRL